MGGESRVGRFEFELVRQMGEVGFLGLEFIDHLECLFDGKVTHVGCIAKGIENEAVEPVKQR